MDYIYSAAANRTVICNHEDSTLNEYKQVINSMIPQFSQYGCTLETSLFWKESFKSNAKSFRPDFKNGYECYVCCTVFRDGKEVRIISDDGEVDYYDASVCWMITRIYRRMFNLCVDLFPDVDSDIYEQMNDILEMIKN